MSGLEQLVEWNGGPATSVDWGLHQLLLQLSTGLGVSLFQGILIGNTCSVGSLSKFMDVADHELKYEWLVS